MCCYLVDPAFSATGRFFFGEGHVTLPLRLPRVLSRGSLSSGIGCPNRKCPLLALFGFPIPVLHVWDAQICIGVVNVVAVPECHVSSGLHVTQ